MDTYDSLKASDITAINKMTSEVTESLHIELP